MRICARASTTAAKWTSLLSKSEAHRRAFLLEAKMTMLTSLILILSLAPRVSLLGLNLLVHTENSSTDGITREQISKRHRRFVILKEEKLDVMATMISKGRQGSK